MRILITGSSGLIGGEAVEYFGTRGHEIVGIDNNMRKAFFGPGGDTLWNLHRVAHSVPSYKHHESDIRNGPIWHTDGLPNQYPGDDALSLYIFAKNSQPFDAVIHCAAQPSHDFAAKNPNLDYRVNVLGTHNMLEATKRHSPRAVFIFMSTNKVYDDAVNETVSLEHETRYDVDGWPGFDESTKTGAENVFGQHKLEADLLVQDYGRRHSMRTVVLRGGCLTGPGHSGVEAHGFLSYLVRCALTGENYHIFGHLGKQVRDNIHSFDVCRAFEQIILRPPQPASVFNIGGGRGNSCSILEAIIKINQMFGVKTNWDYVDEARSGDHRCYITNIGKLQSTFSWGITRSLDDILTDIARITIDEGIQRYEGPVLERLMRARDAMRAFNLKRSA
jgi:CDP-paratose 2-epimerase